MRVPRVASVLVLLGCLACARPSPGTDAGATGHDSGDACGRLLNVQLVVNNFSAEWSGDMTGPHRNTLWMTLDDDSLAPIDRGFPVLRFPAPYFARAMDLNRDVCADEGSSSQHLKVACVQGNKIAHVEAKVEGNAMTVSVDGKEVAKREHACFVSRRYSMTSLPKSGDLEAIRASYGNDGASTRCSSKIATSKSLDVILEATFPKKVSVNGELVENGHCSPTGGRPVAVTQLSIPQLGVKASLGPMINSCGMAGGKLFSDVNGADLVASNLGTSTRFAFQLGDRVFYLTQANRLEAIELPCGASATMRVVAGSWPTRREAFLQ